MSSLQNFIKKKLSLYGGLYMYGFCGCLIYIIWNIHFEITDWTVVFVEFDVLDYLLLLYKYALIF